MDNDNIPFFTGIFLVDNYIIMRTRQSTVFSNSVPVRARFLVTTYRLAHGFSKKHTRWSTVFGVEIFVCLEKAYRSEHGFSKLQKNVLLNTCTRESTVYTKKRTSHIDITAKIEVVFNAFSLATPLNDRAKRVLFCNLKTRPSSADVFGT
ncbi:hypothetical protein [Evansella clarkii]|uniref:hypothetical protein n=1 Tax=Evansella clarkii TaxID=79879 RepID=UPI0009982CC3|nr:hypothetical protein [Evansella clarkii]